MSSEVRVGSRLLLLLSLDLLRADYLPASSGPRDHKARGRHALYAKSRWMDGQTRSSECEQEGRLPLPHEVLHIADLIKESSELIYVAKRFQIMHQRTGLN